MIKSICFMIQRIQSIFLLLSSLSLGSLFLIPFSFADVKVLNGSSSALAQTNLFQDSIFDIMDSPILIGITIFGAVMALIAIFLFRDRKKQLLLTRLSIMLTIVLLILSILLFFQDYNNFPSTATFEFDIEYGLLSVVLGLVFGILANRYIKKDDNLVQSMDRLR